MHIPEALGVCVLLSQLPGALAPWLTASHQSVPIVPSLTLTLLTPSFKDRWANLNNSGKYPHLEILTFITSAKSFHQRSYITTGFGENMWTSWGGEVLVCRPWKLTGRKWIRTHGGVLIFNASRVSLMGCFGLK